LHPEKVKLTKLKYKLTNPEKYKLSIKKANDRKRLLHKETLNLKNKEWRNANKEYIAHTNALARARHRKQTPLWDNELTAFVYMEAKRLTKLREICTGIKWHVDHIVPLKGKLVTGFHIWNNFQVIPAILNIKKHNIFKEIV
jgi:hypothetical protein